MKLTRRVLIKFLVNLITKSWLVLIQVAADLQLELHGRLSIR